MKKRIIGALITLAMVLPQASTAMLAYEYYEYEFGSGMLSAMLRDSMYSITAGDIRLNIKGDKISNTVSFNARNTKKIIDEVIVGKSVTLDVSKSEVHTVILDTSKVDVGELSVSEGELKVYYSAEASLTLDAKEIKEYITLENGKAEEDEAEDSESNKVTLNYAQFIDCFKYSIALTYKDLCMIAEKFTENRSVKMLVDYEIVETDEDGNIKEDSFYWIELRKLALGKTITSELIKLLDGFVKDGHNGENGTFPEVLVYLRGYYEVCSQFERGISVPWFELPDEGERVGDVYDLLKGTVDVGRLQKHKLINRGKWDNYAKYRSIYTLTLSETELLKIYSRKGLAGSYYEKRFIKCVEYMLNVKQNENYERYAQMINDFQKKYSSNIFYQYKSGKLFSGLTIDG